MRTAEKPIIANYLFPLLFLSFPVQLLSQFLFLAACPFMLVGGYIYPTEPVQESVWTAGENATLQWINDEKLPNVTRSQTWLVDVELWMNTNVFLDYLAVNVDPAAMYVQVTVPRANIDNDAIYTVRFTPHDMNLPIVFTGDFHIRAVAGCTNNVTIANQAPPENQTIDPSCVAPPGAALANITSIVTTVGADATAVISSSSISKPKSTTQPGGGEQQQQQLGPFTPNTAGRRVFDVERFKFRLVFIIWPALIGVTMAM